VETTTASIIGALQGADEMYNVACYR
jgi:hypothetical protein